MKKYSKSEIDKYILENIQNNLKDIEFPNHLKKMNKYYYELNFALVINIVLLTGAYFLKSDKPCLMLLGFLSSIMTLAIIDDLRRIYLYNKKNPLIKSYKISLFLNRLFPCKSRSLEIQTLRENYKKKYFLDKEMFKEIDIRELKIWTDKYIYNKSSIHRLIQEQCLGSDKVCLNHLYWSQLIPRSKLKIDNFKAILDNCRISVGDLNDLTDISLSDIELIFRDYSEANLIRLFKSIYTLEEYVFILNIANHHKISLPVYNHMSDVRLFIDKIKYNKEFTFPIDKEWIPLLESKLSPLGEIKHISDISELRNIANYMSNCSFEYKDRILGSKEYFFLISQNNKPYILFCLNASKKLTEAKYKANASLSREDSLLLKELIKEA